MTQPAPKHLAAPTCNTASLRGHLRWPWIAAFVLMICFIWGNSLVPGEESGALSHGVLEWAQGVLAGAGLPWEWLTDYIVRKTAHFTEYLALGLVGMQAFGAHRRPFCLPAAILTVALLLAVPSLDECIQLFVSGRAGMVADVLLDCAGALTGVAVTALVSALLGRR